MIQHGALSDLAVLFTRLAVADMERVFPLVGMTNNKENKTKRGAK